MDESWVSLYSPPQRDQTKFWLKPDEKAPQISDTDLHSNKRMLIIAMDEHGIAFLELCEENERVNAERYLLFLNKWVPNWVGFNNYSRAVILHDNTRPHEAKIVQDFIKENNYQVWEHSIIHQI